MTKSDRLPESFSSIEEAADFWETHSTADDWEHTQKVGFEIVLNRRQRVVVASDLAHKLLLLANEQGVSVETLVNLWIQERVQESVTEDREVAPAA